jgi:hypothetical protein
MKFNMGRPVITANCIVHCERNNFNVYKLLVRHALCDWGDVLLYDRMANERALFEGLRLLSTYKVAQEQIYIITEADRSYTTVMMASDY